MKSEIKLIKKLDFKLPGMTLEGYKVEEFRMVLSNSNNIYISSTENLTVEMRGALKNIEKGDTIVFSHIKASFKEKVNESYMPILEIIVK